MRSLSGEIAVDCTIGDDLPFKPPLFVYVKLFTIFCVLAIVASGCGSGLQFSAEPESGSRSSKLHTEAIHTDFSIAYANSMDKVLDIPIEKIRQHVAQEAILEEDSPFEETCHEGELVGLASCIIPEPELSEDPLIEKNCADSARSWCDPSYEEHYLSYLEQQEFLAAQTAILPFFTSPVKNGLVLRGMQPPQKKRRRGHYGIDVIPSQWERHGIPLKAVEDGTVIVSSWGRGYGYYVVLYHQNGLFSLYSHTLKKSRAKVGQKLNRGETLAYMGKSGNARGYHLHFELIDLRERWRFEESIDTFVQSVAEGRPISSCTCEQVKELLFAKSSKQDPLQYIEGLSLAKRENGKWVAGEAILPTTKAKLAKTK
jgi:hypothetical protein